MFVVEALGDLINVTNIATCYRLVQIPVDRCQHNRMAAHYMGIIGGHFLIHGPHQEFRNSIY